MPDFISIWNELQHSLSQLSPEWLNPLPALLTALFAGLTVRSLATRISLAPAPQRALAEYLAQPSDDKNPQRIAWHDKEAVILFSLGLSNQPGMLNWIRAGAVLLPFLLLLLLGLPWVPALGGGALGYVLTDSFLTSRWRQVRVQMEQELPTFVARLAGTLLVTASPQKALAEVTDTLSEESLLRSWLLRMMANARLDGQKVIEQARGEAAQISPSLALVVFELGRFFETGGAGFAKAFSATAEELSAILEARAVAGSKAESARGAVLMMLAIMGGILFLMLSSPNIRQGFDNPTVQMIAFAALAAMGGGYVFLNGMIDEALEA